MEIVERIFFLSIGGGIGFILGYIVARLQNIEKKVDRVREELHEVDEIVKHDHQHDESGVLQRPTLMHLMLVLVLSITVFATFSAERANNKLDQTVHCLENYNTNQGQALSSRDQAIKASADAEIELWGLYNRLYKEGSLPNTPPERIKELQATLAEAIRLYREKLIRTQKARETFEYDDPDVLSDCEKRD